MDDFVTLYGYEGVAAGIPAYTPECVEDVSASFSCGGFFEACPQGLPLVGWGAFTVRT
jgi:hypothetical protein